MSSNQLNPNLTNQGNQIDQPSTMENIPTPPDTVMAAEGKAMHSDSTKHEYALLEKEIRNLEVETLSTLLELSRQDLNHLRDQNAAQIRFFQNQKWRLVSEIPFIIIGFAAFLIECWLTWNFYHNHYQNSCGQNSNRASSAHVNRVFALELTNMLIGTAGMLVFGVLSILRLGPTLDETDYKSSRNAQDSKDKRRVVILTVVSLLSMAYAMIMRVFI